MQAARSFSDRGCGRGRGPLLRSVAQAELDAILKRNQELEDEFDDLMHRLAAAMQEVSGVCATCLALVWIKLCARARAFSDLSCGL